MSWYLKQMENLLSEQDIRQLKSIYEPTVVAIPPEDARRSLCVMPDGEIRYYGMVNKTRVWGKGEAVYLSSRDCGLSWKLYYTEGEQVLGASVRSPWSGKYLTIRSVSAAENPDNPGTFVCSSMIGPSDPSPEVKKISDRVYSDIFQPVAMHSRKRWLCTMHEVNGGDYTPIVLLSDDDGETWTEKRLPSTPRHEVTWPHQGVRWQNNGAEPSVTELADGTLMLVARTSLDYLYVYYSDDGGDSWSEGEPSIFHNTLTTSFFLRLSDGRNLLFWCNTRPLPELNHSKYWPPVEQSVLEGRSEDVFTNRDVNHAAITSDGRHWVGFREIFLNRIRHDADYRTKGGKVSSADKSVQQFQALELPYGKVLLAFGQHEVARKLVIFDVNWLYETSRSEDFQTGLANVSTHVYVKSISGSHLEQIPGHCQWNRTYGALLVPDPDATYHEVLQIARIRDPRLFSEVQGAVWNFPAARKGELQVELRIAGSGVRLSLVDHWFNPIDVTVRELAQISFNLTTDVLPQDEWCTISVRYDLDIQNSFVYCDDQLLFQVPVRYAAPCGISYVHLQSLAEQEDAKGTYIRKLFHRSMTS